MSRRLFITGGWGYVGRGIVRAATASGWMVFEPKHGELDVRDEQATRQAITASRSDVVIHAAYRASGPDTWTTNVDGTASVARAAVTAGARFIHFSTDIVFPGRTTAYTEDVEPGPINDYGRSKTAAEKAVLLIAPQAAIVRTSVLYSVEHVGPTGEAILAAALGHADTTFYTDEVRSFTHIDDLVSSTMDLCYHDYAGVLHVAGPEPVSRYDFAVRFARRNGISPAKLKGDLTPPHGPPRPNHVVLDSGRAGGLLTTRLRGVTELLGAP